MPITGITAILVLIITMRIKQNPGLTIRSLFSRRSKQAKNEKAPKRCSTSASDHNDFGSTLRTARPKALDKELEILGLLVDPRKELPQTPIPRCSHSQPRPSSASARRPKTATPPPHNLSLFPAVHTYQDPDFQEQEHDESTTSSSQTHEPHHPPSPLLPPTPSLWLPLQTQRAPQQPAEPDLSIPSSPALSYRTFATRSSGIFPWGTEPHTVDDGIASDTLLDDQVLVLPSPPRFARSYGWSGI